MIEARPPVQFSFPSWIKIFLDQVWPDFVYGMYDAPQSANMQITFYATNYPGDTPVQHGPYQVNVNKKFFSPRIRARLISVKVECSDAAAFWRIGAIRYRGTADGKFG